MPARPAVWLAGMAFIAGTLLLVPTARVTGPTWDEVYYMTFVDHIEGWLAAGLPGDRDSLARHWQYDANHNPHPPAIKVVSAVARFAGARRLPFPLSYRLGPILLNQLCLAAVLFLVCRGWGPSAAWLVWVFILFQPRCFAHAGFLATDMLVAMVWLLLPLAVWFVTETPLTARQRLGWGLGVGMIWGLGVGTKFPACLVAGPVVVWLLWRRAWRGLSWFGAVAGVAVVVFLLVSPMHLRQPLATVLEYLSYPFRGVQVAFWTYYLGRARQTPELPWHYFPVMLATTMVPVSLLCLPGAPLCFGRTSGPRRSAGLLLGLLLATWVCLALLPSTPKHDVERQLLPLVVLLAAAAGLGAAGLVDALRRTWPAGQRLRWWLVGMLVAMPLVSTLTHQTSGLSYFNAFVGGTRGADASGVLAVSYWLEQVDRDLTAQINRVLPPRAAITMEPNPAHLAFLQAKGWLRPDLEVVPSREQASFVLLVRSDALIDLGVFRGIRFPIVERRVAGVPVARLFRIR